MLSDFLQEQAALYASGAMAGAERDDFELILEFHEELRRLTNQLVDIANAAILSSVPTSTAAPSSALKPRLESLIAGRAQQRAADGLVAAGPDELVEWVNPEFSAMCGYTLDELRGRKLGPILQGVGTDRETALRIRHAVKKHLPVRETILNYHKSGAPYWVDISIRPILDDAGRTLWFIAREREVSGRIAA
jgi:PAS domain S-box-containing protein